MERANQSYREKQYEQHHQDTDKALSTATATAASSSTNNVDTPWDKYKATLHTLTQNQVKLNQTLSERLQIIKNMLTWNDYKHLVNELQLKKEECLKLQEEVASLKRQLGEVEEGTVDRAHTPPQEDGDGGGKYDEDLELKTLEDKAKEYDETMQESKVNRGDSVRWH